jgi:GNAT superfamily N-acetyltransferase
MNLQALEPEQLLATQRIAALLFPWESEHQEALAAVIYPTVRDAFLHRHSLHSVRCWTTKSGHDVAGFASVYGYTAQPDELWLAWFGLRPEFRGRGAGAELLDAVIALAEREGRETLRLWTTDEEEYATAIRLYLRRGFVPEVCAPMPGETWRTEVFSLALRGGRPRLWADVPQRPALCGREEPLVAA